MALDNETKLYVKEIVEEAVENVSHVCMDRDKRIRDIEKKVFNGYGTSIKILFVLHGVLISLAVKAVFF